MDSNDFLKKGLEHWKQQRQARIEEMLAELADLDITIRQHEMQLGEAPEDLPSPFAAQALGGVKVTKPVVLQAGSGSYKPRADEFFGKPQAEAARLYLEKIGHAMSLDDIFLAITSGGCKVGGADPKRTLLVTLSQSKRDFVNTGGGNWGLRKFYPNMPKLGRPEGAIPKKASTKRAKSKSAKRNVKTKAKATKPKMLNSARVAASGADEQDQVVQ